MRSSPANLLGRYRPAVIFAASTGERSEQRIAGTGGYRKKLLLPSLAIEAAEEAEILFRRAWLQVEL